MLDISIINWMINRLEHIIAYFRFTMILQLGSAAWSPGMLIHCCRLMIIFSLHAFHGAITLISFMRRNNMPLLAVPFLTFSCLFRHWCLFFALRHAAPRRARFGAPFAQRRYIDCACSDCCAAVWLSARDDALRAAHAMLIFSFIFFAQRHDFFMPQDALWADWTTAIDLFRRRRRQSAHWCYSQHICLIAAPAAFDHFRRSLSYLLITPPFHCRRRRLLCWLFFRCRFFAFRLPPSADMFLAVMVTLPLLSWFFFAGFYLRFDFAMLLISIAFAFRLILLDSFAFASACCCRCRHYFRHALYFAAASLHFFRRYCHYFRRYLFRLQLWCHHFRYAIYDVVDSDWFSFSLQRFLSFFFYISLLISLLLPLPHTHFDLLHAIFAYDDAAIYARRCFRRFRFICHADDATYADYFPLDCFHFHAISPLCRASRFWWYADAIYYFHCCRWFSYFVAIASISFRLFSLMLVTLLWYSCLYFSFIFRDAAPSPPCFTRAAMFTVALFRFFLMLPFWYGRAFLLFRVFLIFDSFRYCLMLLISATLAFSWCHCLPRHDIWFIAAAATLLILICAIALRDMMPEQRYAAPPYALIFLI